MQAETFEPDLARRLRMSSWLRPPYGISMRKRPGQNKQKKAFVGSVITQIAALHVTSLLTERTTLTFLIGSQALSVRTALHHSRSKHVSSPLPMEPKHFA